MHVAISICLSPPVVNRQRGVTAPSDLGVTGCEQGGSDQTSNQTGRFEAFLDAENARLLTIILAWISRNITVL